MQEDELTCNICFDYYGEVPKDPKILSCGHSFCSSCIESILKNSKLCATCRKYIKYKSIDEIPINYSLKHLAEKDKQNFQDQNGICNEHKCPENWDCLDCKRMVCGSCAMLNHKDCTTKLIDGQIFEKRKEMMKQVDKAKKFFVKYLKSLDKKAEDLQAKNDKVQETISYFKEKIHEAEAELNAIEMNQAEIGREHENIENFHGRLQNTTAFLPEDINTDDIDQLGPLHFLLEETESLMNSLNISQLPEQESDEAKLVQPSAPIFEEESPNSTTTCSAASPSHQQCTTSVPDIQDLLQQWRSAPVNDNFVTVKNRLLTGEIIHLVHESTNQGNPLFGRLEFRNDRIRIHSFTSDHPLESSCTILMPQFLMSLYGSTKLPARAFFELDGRPDNDIVVKVDENLEESPRALNFLFLILGLMGPSYKYKSLKYWSTTGAYIRCPWRKNGEEVQDAVVREAITNDAIYSAPKRRGFVYGGDASAVHYLSSVSFCVETNEEERLKGKFGEVVGGFELLRQLRSGSNYTVTNCGLMIAG